MLDNTLERKIVTIPPVRSRPTITDVAKLCGVTPATVSRVLNGKQKFSASEGVRQKIFDTARKLGYVPDLAARNLNRRSTHIIGLFASPRTHLAEGINESLLEGIAGVLHNGGYDVFLELSSSNAAEHPLPFWRFDGAILMQAPKPETVTELNRRHVPYVCVNERVGNPVASVLADDAMGMNRALDHLVQLGHKRIAYANARATYFSHYSVTERYETLLSGARKRSLSVVDNHDQPFSSATDFLEDAVKEGSATAVITYDHHIAVALVGTAVGMGLRIPQDFSVICFNDVFPVGLLPPPLTAVAVSGREMGRIGADLLLNSLLTPRTHASREIRIPEDLIVRASTAPPHHHGTRTTSE
jgi:LacI family transcriptional regulator